MRIYFIFIVFCCTSFFYAQSQNNIIANDSLKAQPIDPLRPAKAGFYSAILPGLGQVYNKKYWKVPLVYGAIGTSIYFYVDSRKQYNIYRNEYKSRLAGGQNNSEYLARLSDSQLISAQKQFKRNGDLSLLFALGFYVLNIIDANVDAALSQFNVSNQLAFKPTININEIAPSKNVGLSCVYSF
ncbi:DUF5683 domain-containing protein [Flavobacterium aquidurense]|uniref:DUF5683 domain-containing protein n=1 Tax=Flavobacterium aquidurense TaxID=362413 RepID=UPI002866A61F|nr:DUF5683 domain-containing protein [Flavobacterium aquidurense]MDR7369623.1 hypothetical protein [Flavobacterium aquidurense]